MTNNQNMQFKGKQWKESVDVRSFIQENYSPYSGDESFLQPATQRTKTVFAAFQNLLEKEHQAGGVLDIATDKVASILTFDAGYIDSDKEIIVGLQTDAPLKRSVNPFGGIRMARTACENYGFKLSDEVENFFTYRTTHNDGVFNAL